MSNGELDPEKRYFTIGEVAEHLGVNVSTLRFWETEFTSVKPKKNRKGNRVYTHSDIDEVRLIHHLLKDRGYTLEGARKKLRTERKETEKKADIARRLNKVKSALENLKNQL
jgi:DNA-binding transcriptional MerR regulator